MGNRHTQNCRHVNGHIELKIDNQFAGRQSHKVSSHSKFSHM